MPRLLPVPWSPRYPYQAHRVACSPTGYISSIPVKDRLSAVILRLCFEMSNSTFSFTDSPPRAAPGEVEEEDAPSPEVESVVSEGGVSQIVVEEVSYTYSTPTPSATTPEKDSGAAIDCSSSSMVSAHKGDKICDSPPAAPTSVRSFGNGVEDNPKSSRQKEETDEGSGVQSVRSCTPEGPNEEKENEIKTEVADKNAALQKPKDLKIWTKLLIF